MTKSPKKQKSAVFRRIAGVLLLLASVAVFLVWLNRVPPLEDNPYTPEDFYWQDGFLVCSAGETVMGIDVSAHQQVIDWQQVKQAGVEFAFIRLGYRGYASGQLHRDDYAAANLAGAQEAGISIGAYLFSQAISVEEAAEEAEFALACLEGIPLDLPLVYDWEYVSEDARTKNVDRRTLTDCTLSFSRRVKNAGYEPMVYFNSCQAQELLYLEELTRYRFWLAMYDTAAAFPYRVDFWQYTDQGQIPGIEGDVDINIMFRE